MDKITCKKWQDLIILSAKTGGLPKAVAMPHLFTPMKLSTVPLNLWVPTPAWDRPDTPQKGVNEPRNKLMFTGAIS